jgi:hypothetical protein
MEVIMKRKTIYNLQLFADEPQTEPANDPTEQKAKSKSDGTQESNEDKAGEAQKKLYTDEDVDKLINRKFAEWQAKKDQEINEAQKLAEMNEQQKAEYKLDKLQKELDEYKNRETLSEMAKTARSILSEQNINIPDELVSVLVTTDADTTSANVKAFAKAFQSAVSQAVDSKISHREPRTGGSKTVTKNDIMAIKDTATRQKAIAENIELFGGK